jgi:hypothetical protein
MATAERWRAKNTYSGWPGPMPAFPLAEKMSIIVVSFSTGVD